MLLAGTGWLMGTPQAVAAGGTQHPSTQRVTAALSGGADPDRVQLWLHSLALPCALCSHIEGFPRPPAVTGWCHCHPRVALLPLLGGPMALPPPLAIPAVH